jgi:hypothetical protein
MRPATLVVSLFALSLALTACEPFTHQGGGAGGRGTAPTPDEQGGATAPAEQSRVATPPTSPGGGSGY